VTERFEKSSIGHDSIVPGSFEIVALSEHEGEEIVILLTLCGLEASLFASLESHCGVSDNGCNRLNLLSPKGLRWPSLVMARSSSIGARSEFQLVSWVFVAV
jgi:hypothetical protein